MEPTKLQFQHQRLLEGLRELYEHQQLTDVILIAEEVQIACHRNVLASTSPYFRAMFTSELKETQEESVVMHGVDPLTLKSIIDYIYTAQLNITCTNAQSIFSAASLLEMLDLCKLCASFMTSELHMLNCSALYQFGSFHNCEDLRESSRAFIVEHFDDLAKSDDLLALDYDDLSDVIIDDNLNIRCEEVVYEMVMRWIEYDTERRKRHLGVLLSEVRLGLLPEKYISDCIETNTLISDNRYCGRLIAEARDQQSEKQVQDEEQGFLYHCGESSCRPRIGMYNRPMLVFIGGSHEADKRALACYDPKSKKNYWAIPFHVTFDYKYRIDLHKGVVTDKNQIFIIGGIFYTEHHLESRGKALREVKEFDPFGKTWEARESLMQPRCAHAAVYLQGHIYAIGGQSTYPIGTPLSSVEQYNVEEDEWTFVAALPYGLYNHCAVTHNDKIYVVGGMTDEEHVTKTFLEYSTVGMHWTPVERTMMHPRAEFGAGVIGDELFVVCGNNGQFKVNSVERCHLPTKKWHFCKEFPEDRKSMAVAVFEGALFICGGERTVISRQNHSPRTVEARDLWKLDIEAETWTKETRLVQFANLHACFVAEMNTKRLYESEFISQ